MVNPMTVAEVPVLDKPLMILPEKLMPEEVFEQTIPATLPPVPVEDKLLIVLEATVMDVAVLTADPIVIPVIAACPVILVTVFDERLDTPFQ